MKTNELLKWDIIVLSLLKIKDCYGYEMSKMIHEMSNGILKASNSTLYPVLHSLMNKEYISSTQIIDQKSHKVKVYYHLEDPGKVYLENAINNYQRLIEGMDRIIYYQESGDQ